MDKKYKLKNTALEGSDLAALERVLNRIEAEALNTVSLVREFKDSVDTLTKKLPEYGAAGDPVKRVMPQVYANSKRLETLADEVFKILYVMGEECE